MINQEFLDKAKKIFIKLPGVGIRFPIDGEEYRDIIDKYKDEIIFLGTDSGGDDVRYLSTHNEHHYQTKYMYKNWIPKINECLNININEDDFFLVDNIIDREDFSYLQAKKEKIFDCQYCDYSDIDVIYVLTQSMKCNYASLCNTAEVVNGQELSNLGWGVETPYHRLFSFSHQVCIITNEGENNGKTLFLSSDSHMVPIIPMLCYYYKRVIVYDNRTVYNFDFSSLLDGANDFLIVFTESYHPNKYISLDEIYR